jgi:iron complex transport system substrate-binding protein
MYGNMWYQPSKISTAGGIVADAGGKLPFDINLKGGSLAMSKEQVLCAAKDAEVWIIRYQGNTAMTLQQLSALSPVYSQFRAFREGNVWGVNTSQVAYFDEAPFRPDYLLEDMINILHPELKLSAGMHYYSRLR